ncbi:MULTISPECIES: hypothetical protein [unclassified Wolbachia]|uniref:hypothetical protein n=1 Tax=unclassified Wolbachia TaxID=2640676 RepID=UPI002230349B|nr:hypothetical protein [Wolbachia endosymbiont (group A) of Apoderus coryli]
MTHNLYEHCYLSTPGRMSPSTSFPVIPLTRSGISFHFMMAVSPSPVIPVPRHWNLPS